MNTYFIKFRGTKAVYTVVAETQQKAFEKLAKHENMSRPAYMQRVFKCDYQDMNGVVIK